MEETKGVSTFSKVTAVLCALAMLFAFIAFFGNKLMDKTEALKEQIEYKKTQITQIETKIAQQQETITNLQQQKQQKEQELESVRTEQSEAVKIVEDKEIALEQAEEALDQVCTRSYYSSWSCSSACRSLHNAVSAREDELNEAKAALGDYADLQDEILTLEANISRAVDTLADEQDALLARKAEYKEIRGELNKIRLAMTFKVLAWLLALGGLGLLAWNFYNGAQDKFTFYAVAGLAASSFLFLITGGFNNWVYENAPILYLLISPHAWNLAVMALFGAVLLKKTEKPVVLRNIAVVLAVIGGVLAVNVNPFVGVVYAAAMICTAFVIVPLVFTEYIDIAKHIFLSIITFGIWQLVWIYHVTKNLNKVEAIEERRPARELLLSLFLLLYYPYWLYKTAEGVEDYGKEAGKVFKIDVLCLAFSFVSPLFASVLIQNKINVVVGKPVCPEIALPELPEEVEAEPVEAE